MEESKKVFKSFKNVSPVRVAMYKQSGKQQIIVDAGGLVDLDESDLASLKELYPNGRFEQYFAEVATQEEAQAMVDAGEAEPVLGEPEAEKPKSKKKK